jgi:hypothetical protein
MARAEREEHRQQRADRLRRVEALQRPLEAALHELEQIEGWAEHRATIRGHLERAQAGRWLPQELQARQRTLHHARASLAQQRERLTNAYLHGIMALPEFEQRRRDLERKDHTIALQEEQLRAQAHRHQERAALATGMQAFCQRASAGLAAASFEQKRQLVELLIDRVVVTDDDVEIRYCIPTTPATEHVRFCHLRTDYFDPAEVRVAEMVGPWNRYPCLERPPSDIGSHRVHPGRRVEGAGASIRRGGQFVVASRRAHAGC